MSAASTRRPLRIAVFLQLETEHGRGILRGIAQFFRQHPEVTVLKFGRAERYQLFEVHRLNVDGIIAKVANLHDERTLAGLRVPVVNVSGQCATPRIPTVNTDDERVGRMAAGHFLSRGYRTLGYCGDNTHLASRLRCRGFVAEAKAGSVGRIHTISLARSDGDSALQPEIVKWIQKLPKPVGLFGFTDQMAIAIAEAASVVGLEVPQQLAILGVGNDLTRLDFAHVDVSSIQLNTQRIGQLSGELLYEQLSTGRRMRKLTLLPPAKIATRKSTDLFAVEDDAVAQAMDYIRENVGNTIYVDEVARAAGMSRRLLEMKFRNDLKTSVYAEVQRAHFERAIELMGEPELTLSEIAYAAGFESAQRFSTSFRLRYGVSPLGYRNEMRKGRGARGKNRRPAPTRD